jgi:hypothetical protein
MMGLELFWEYPQPYELGNSSFASIFLTFITTYLHIPSLTHIKLEIKITNNKKSLIPKQVDSWDNLTNQ